MHKIFYITAFFLAVWAFLIEPHLLAVKAYKIRAFDGLKIVFASDFHISKFGQGRLERVVRLINKQNPDIVLLGGDFINGISNESTLSIEKQAEILKMINAPAVTVLGNHDGLYGNERIVQALKTSGITVLSNENIKIKDIIIAGVEDLKTAHPDWRKALEGTSGKRILLTHSPDIYYDIDDSVDLILAGHTHGGQVSFPIVGAPIVPSKYGSKFARRMISETQNLMIITKGIGTSILPVRFGSVPEIVVIE